MADNTVAKVFRVFLLKAEAVVLFVFVPLFELDDKVNVLRVTDTRDTEQSFDVDDSDAAQFDEVLRDVRCGADQRLLGDTADFDDIIRDGVLV